MQTFMPYPPIFENGAYQFKNSLEVLDVKRLGKQRLEGLQILQTLLGMSDGWKNHPATRMWRGHESLLTAYTGQCCQVWIERGYRDTILDRIHPIVIEFDLPSPMEVGPPSWFGDIEFHRSHQSNLLRKDPGHYGKYFPEVPSDLPYVWPVGRN